MIKFNDTEILYAYFNGRRLDNIIFNGQPLLPTDGLFDAAGKCIASWHTLTSPITAGGYGMDCWTDYTASGDTSYNSSLASPYRVLRDNPELAGGVKLIIPDTVSKIGAMAFRDCTKLTNISLPDSVTSIGSSAFSGCRMLESIVIPEDVNMINDHTFDSCNGLESAEIKGEVLSIGQYAFYKCTKLKSLPIVNSVTSIGPYAFAYCTGLTEIAIYNNTMSIGDGAFVECTNLSNAVLGNGVTSIGYRVFEKCSGLTSMQLPFVGDDKYNPSNTHFGYIFGASQYSDNFWHVPTRLQTVKITGGSRIAAAAFYECNTIKNLTLPFVGASPSAVAAEALFGYIFGTERYTGSVETKQQYAPNSYTTYYIPANLSTVVITGVSNIPYGAFSNCKGLTSITIPSSVTRIGEAAFEWCTGLTSITIEYGVKSIGDDAFFYCSSLTQVQIPNSVTSIGAHAFSNCKGLTSITIPDSVTSIGDYAFYFCDSLTYNEYDNAYYLGNENNQYLYLAEAKSQDVTSCTIHANTRLIGAHAFSDCESLTSITIPNGVTSIGDSAFRECHSLTSINIPNSVTSIGEWAFYYCDSLTSIALPHGVLYINDRAFRDCSKLAYVLIPNSVLYIGEYVFFNCSKLPSITFNGTKEQFGQVTTDLHWNYKNLEDDVCPVTFVYSQDA